MPQSSHAPSPAAPRKQWPHGEITAAVLNAAREVQTHFAGRAYSEENYREAIANHLRRHGFRAATLVECVRLDQYRQIVGHSQADLVVNDCVVVLVKVVTRLKASTNHSKPPVPHEYIQKLRTYMLDGHWSVGLAVVFGPKQYLYRRLDQPAATPEGQ